jgi:hypothetical protein
MGQAIVVHPMGLFFPSYPIPRGALIYTMRWRIQQHGQPATTAPSRIEIMKRLSRDSVSLSVCTKQ